MYLESEGIQEGFPDRMGFRRVFLIGWDSGGFSSSTSSQPSAPPAFPRWELRPCCLAAEVCRAKRRRAVSSGGFSNWKTRKSFFWATFLSLTYSLSLRYLSSPCVGSSRCLTSGPWLLRRVSGAPEPPWLSRLALLSQKLSL